MNKKKIEATDIFYKLFVDFLDDLSRIRPSDSILFIFGKIVQNNVKYYYAINI